MKIRATRQVLAVVAVTTALCADGLTRNPALSRTPVAEMAGRLVMRFAQRLRRVVAAIVPAQERHRAVGATRQLVPVAVSAFVAPRPISPFEFRLPPPLF